MYECVSVNEFSPVVTSLQERYYHPRYKDEETESQRDLKLWYTSRPQPVSDGAVCLQNPSTFDFMVLKLLNHTFLICT